MPPEAIFDYSQVDFNHLVIDKEGIRRVNQQRYEMEQLDGIVYIDTEQHVIVGYKDVRADEFWARGHMPDYPIFPGVLMCEAVAQLCSFYIAHYRIVEAEFIGLAGLENIRVRGAVYPGDRLILVAKASKIHRKQVVFNVQAFVGSTLVFHGDVIGVPLSKRPNPRSSAPAEG